MVFSDTHSQTLSQCSPYKPSKHCRFSQVSPSQPFSQLQFPVTGEHSTLGPVHVQFFAQLLPYLPRGHDS